MHPYWQIRFRTMGEETTHNASTTSETIDVIKYAMIVSDKVTVERMRE